jgi:hypothetical protein
MYVLPENVFIFKKNLKSKLMHEFLHELFWICIILLRNCISCKYFILTVNCLWKALLGKDNKGCKCKCFTLAI